MDIDNDYKIKTIEKYFELGAKNPRIGTPEYRLLTTLESEIKGMVFDGEEILSLDFGLEQTRKKYENLEEKYNKLIDNLNNIIGIQSRRFNR